MLFQLNFLNNFSIFIDSVTANEYTSTCVRMLLGRHLWPIWDYNTFHKINRMEEKFLYLFSLKNQIHTLMIITSVLFIYQKKKLIMNYGSINVPFWNSILSIVVRTRCPQCQTTCKDKVFRMRQSETKNPWDEREWMIRQCNWQVQVKNEDST